MKTLELIRPTGATKSTKATPAVKFVEGPRLKGRKTSKPMETPAPSADDKVYRVGSISKLGRVRWAYSELMTLEEAELIAGVSRLKIIQPGKRALKTLLLSPRAERHLERYRLKKSDPKAYARQKRERRARAREVKAINEEYGRIYGVGMIGENGRLERTYFDDISKAEAEAVVDGTNLSVISPGQFDEHTLQSRWNGFPRNLFMKLHDFRNKANDQKWHGRYWRGQDKLPRSRKLTLWVLVSDGVRTGGNIVDITLSEQEAGRLVDSYAQSAMRLLPFRIEIDVPTVPTKPKPPKRANPVRSD